MATQPQPGDFLLDRFVPNESPERREEAREAFRRLALLLANIGERIARDPAVADDSRESGKGAILDQAGSG